MSGFLPRLGLSESTLIRRASIWKSGWPAAYICSRCRARRNLSQRRNTQSGSEPPIKHPGVDEIANSSILEDKSSVLSATGTKRRRDGLPPAAPNQSTGLPPSSLDAISALLWRMGVDPTVLNQALKRVHVDAAAEFDRALQRRESAAALLALFSAANDPAFVARISNTTWTQFFRVIHPNHLLAPFHRAHRDLTESQLRAMNIDFDVRCPLYFQMLRSVISTRREHGIPLDVLDYVILLQYAANKGNASAAQALWNDMKRDGVQPDVDCYNYYMEAKVFDEYSRIKRTMDATTNPQNGKSYLTFVGDRFTLFRKNVRLNAEITKLFTEMSDHGIAADTKTFATLIFAMARDEEVDKINALLWRVWKIDVNALLNGATATMRLYPRDSPLAPTSKLLAALADAYGSSQNTPMGLAVIDYISLQCQLPVRSHIWYQLLQWTYFDAICSKDRLGHPRLVRLKIRSVSRIFSIMVSPPYNIKPTMEMYHLLIISLARARVKPRRMVQVLEEGKRLYESMYPSAPTEKWRPDRKPKRIRDRVFMLRWAKAAISYCQDSVYLRRGLPSFLLDWEKHIPSQIRYRTRTGIVELSFRSPLEIATNRASRAELGNINNQSDESSVQSHEANAPPSLHANHRRSKTEQWVQDLYDSLDEDDEMAYMDEATRPDPGD